MLKKIDIFGQPVKILVNKNPTVTTTLGGIFTIMSFFLIVIFTWFIGRDILFKEKPFSYTQRDVFKTFETIFINKYSFPFSFVLTNEDNFPLYSPDYLKLYLLNYHYEFDEKNENMYLDYIEDIPFRNCRYEDFPNLTEEEFSEAQLKFTMCPFDTNYNFTLFGYWTESRISYLSVAVKKCGGKIPNLIKLSNITRYENLKYQRNLIDENFNNSIENIEFDLNGQDIKCKSDEEIGDYLEKTGANLNLYYKDYKVKLNNNSIPYESFVASNYKYLIDNLIKKTNFFLNSISIKTDNGLIFESLETSKFLKLTEMQSDTRLVNKEEKLILTLDIFSSNLLESYFRRYVKVSEILASMGGIIRVFYLVFYMINMFFTRIIMVKNLINEIFILKVDNETEDKINLFKNKKNDIFSISKHKNANKIMEKNILKTSKVQVVTKNQMMGINEIDHSNVSPSISKSKRQNINKDKNYDVSFKLQNLSNKYHCADLYFNFDKKLIKQDESFNENKWLTDSLKGNIGRLSSKLFKSPFKSKQSEKVTSPIKQDQIINEVINEEEEINLKKDFSSLTRNNHFINLGSSKLLNSDKELNYIEKINNDIKNILQKNLKNIGISNKQYFKINFFICDLLRIVCIPSKNKFGNKIPNSYRFFIKGKNKTNAYFDMVNIIKKFEEIELIKNILFVDYQKDVVNYLSKPILNLGKSIEKEFENVNEEKIQISKEDLKNIMEIDSEAKIFQKDQIIIENYLNKVNLYNIIDQNILINLNNHI